MDPEAKSSPAGGSMRISQQTGLAEAERILSWLQGEADVYFAAARSWTTISGRARSSRGLFDRLPPATVRAPMRPAE